jgi:hypothetical protein
MKQVGYIILAVALILAFLYVSNRTWRKRNRWITVTPCAVTVTPSRRDRRLRAARWDGQRDNVVFVMNLLGCLARPSCAQ